MKVVSVYMGYSDDGLKFLTHDGMIMPVRPTPTGSSYYQGGLKFVANERLCNEIPDIKSDIRKNFDDPNGMSLGRSFSFIEASSRIFMLNVRVGRRKDVKEVLVDELDKPSSSKNVLLCLRILHLEFNEFEVSNDFPDQSMIFSNVTSGRPKEELYLLEMSPSMVLNFRATVKSRLVLTEEQGITSKYKLLTRDLNSDPVRDDEGFMGIIYLDENGTIHVGTPASVLALRDKLGYKWSE